MQLERARVKYLVRGELESGKEAVQLRAPEEEPKVDEGKEKGGEEAGVGVEGEREEGGEGEEGGARKDG
jgi:hypothetical protein